MRPETTKFFLLTTSLISLTFIYEHISQSSSHSSHQTCNDDHFDISDFETHPPEDDFKYICCYRDPNHPNDNIGRPFKVHKSMAKYVDNYVNAPGIEHREKHDYVIAQKPQPVTAFSENHYSEHMEYIGSALRVFKNQKIVIYDLGMSEDQIAYVQRNDSFIYRQLDFAKFPAHVSKLTTYAWKTLIWAEMLKEYQAITWFDTSMVWFEEKKFQTAVQKYIVNKKSSILFYGHDAGHSNAWATNARMWSYFPSNMTEHGSKTQNTMKQANGVILVNTEDFKQNVMKWAVLCVLVEDCIAPMMVNGKQVNKWCPKGKETQDQGYICHRFDQSLFSLLSHNYYYYDPSIYSLNLQSEYLGQPKRVASKLNKWAKGIEAWA